MTASLPTEIQQVFDRFITTEFTTIDAHGQPITWPLTPYYRLGDACIDVTTGVGYPKKAKDARANPRVAALFSDRTGSGLENPPQVLVHGTADVDDRDLDANRERYWNEAREKLPGTAKMHPPKPLRRALGWYYVRIYIHIRPERIYVWPHGDITAEPTLYDAHIEEVRSGHDEEPPAAPATAHGGAGVWDERIDELGARYPSAVVSLVAPDGFPFSLRAPITVDREAHRVRIGSGALGVPVQPGLACVTAHEHHPDFTWQRNFQVRGDLVEEDGGWTVIPHKLVGGFELPDQSMAANWRMNAKKVLRYRKIAKRELAARGR